MALVSDRTREQIGNIILYRKPVENGSRGEIVGSINNQVSSTQQLSTIPCSQGLDYYLCFGPGVARVQFSAEDFGLRQVGILTIRADEPMEVALLNNILVDEPQVSYSEAGQEIGGSASNASGSDDRKPG
jgi:hypothetical protein